MVEGAPQPAQAPAKAKALPAASDEAFISQIGEIAEAAPRSAGDPARSAGAQARSAADPAACAPEPLGDAALVREKRRPVLELRGKLTLTLTLPLPLLLVLLLLLLLTLTPA